LREKRVLAKVSEQIKRLCDDGTLSLETALVLPSSLCHAETDADIPDKSRKRQKSCNATPQERLRLLRLFFGSFYPEIRKPQMHRNAFEEKHGLSHGQLRTFDKACLKQQWHKYPAAWLSGLSTEYIV
jgi:hypothetical protein